MYDHQEQSRPFSTSRSQEPAYSENYGGIASNPLSQPYGHSEQSSPTQITQPHDATYQMSPTSSAPAHAELSSYSTTRTDHRRHPISSAQSHAPNRRQPTSSLRPQATHQQSSYRHPSSATTSQLHAPSYVNQADWNQQAPIQDIEYRMNRDPRLSSTSGPSRSASTNAYQYQGRHRHTQRDSGQPVPASSHRTNVEYSSPNQTDYASQQPMAISHSQNTAWLGAQSTLTHGNPAAGNLEATTTRVRPRHSTHYGNAVTPSASANGQRPPCRMPGCTYPAYIDASTGEQNEYCGDSHSLEDMVARNLLR
ncbi:hypothetical protein EW146_g10383, partial [Bondarzewia mesenterica]